MYIRVHATPGFEQMCIRLLAPARKGGSDFLAGATVPRLLAVTFQRVQWPASPPIWNSVESPTSCREIPTYLAPSTNFLSSRPSTSFSGGKGRGAVSLSRGNNASPEPPLRFSPIERREEEGEAWTWTRARTRAGETLERRKWRRQPLTC